MLNNNKSNSITSLYPFIPSSLEANKDFIYLKSELEKLSSPSNYFSPVTVNLNRLLAEVTFTFSPDLQQELLTKIKSWYLSKTQDSKVSASIIKPKEIELPKEYPKSDSSMQGDKGMVYVPKRYKGNKVLRKPSIKNDPEVVFYENLNTRESSSELNHIDKRRRMSQSPGIIQGIVNDFVKNKRVKMYNFTLEAFLADKNIVKNRQRPMSCMMKKQIDDLDEIKLKLSNKGVRCGFYQLFHGYVLDDREKYEASALPKGGMGLMKMPTLKTKKKKLKK